MTPRIVPSSARTWPLLARRELYKVKGKGRVFKVPANLQRKFGAVRVFNVAAGRSQIVGRAIGRQRVG